MAAIVLVAGAPALAQTREAPTLRRLDWAGRPETSGPAGLRRPAPVIPHAGAAPTEVALRPARAWRPTPDRIDGRPGLTPADAFFRPGETVAAPAPQPFRAAEPVAVSPPAPSPPVPERRPQPQPQPQPQAERRTAPVAAATLPAEAPRTTARLVQPSPVAVRPAPPAPQPVAQPEAAQVEADPMAPRRDAPIFRIQGARPPQGEPQVQPAAVPAPEAAPGQGQAQGQAQPYGQGARYYSVHRQAGRQPDRTPMPEQVWLDRMPIEMDRTPESEDLAAPPETPQMMRDAQGRMRPVQATATDGDLP
jgi:hypothetical protein